MHNVIKILKSVADRYAPSRMISFDIAHVFKALQLMEKYGRVSRALLTDELNLGEGSIKTFVKNLKMQELIGTSNAGMWLTIFIIPFLKYPANPPTVGDPDTVVLRSILYLSFIAISGLGAIGFYRLYKKLQSGKKIAAFIGYAVFFPDCSFLYNL